jgi:diadenosine tetraphosphate (Ap4A) HIT family hydrolase
LVGRRFLRDRSQRNEIVVNANSSCPFCSPDRIAGLWNDRAYARFDLNLVTPGHLLLVPFRHIANYFETTDEERRALQRLLLDAKVYLDAQHEPAGYNIGINVGEAAGQTVVHVHVHPIPRYVGDIYNPRGGVRGVIPANQSY